MCSSMKIEIRKIRIILDIENWLWKSEFCKLLMSWVVRSNSYQKDICSEFTHLHIQAGPSMKWIYTCCRGSMHRFLKFPTWLAQNLTVSQSINIFFYLPFLVLLGIFFSIRLHSAHMLPLLSKLGQHACTS